MSSSRVVPPRIHTQSGTDVGGSGAGGGGGGGAATTGAGAGGSISPPQREHTTAVSRLPSAQCGHGAEPTSARPEVPGRRRSDSCDVEPLSSTIFDGVQKSG